MTISIPELSIIVPALNDADELRELLECLEKQTGITFELIICDGGSSDHLPELVTAHESCVHFPLRLVHSPRGRGAQMNIGATQAAGQYLLFLHADSRFFSSNALAAGLEMFKRHPKSASAPCAARFRLRFRRNIIGTSPAYFYHEAKARLDRGDCIRGDQGYLLEKSTFKQLGCYTADLPFLEDVRLAARVAQTGTWLLLPDEISTSARRFEQEGFYERQVANVIIVNAMEIGWIELLKALPGLYSCDRKGRLMLFPLLNGVRTLIAGHDRAWRNSFWKATGSHVAANAWQIFFWADARRTFKAGGTPDNVDPLWLGFYERRMRSLCETDCAGWLARVLTRLWFTYLLISTAEEPSEGR